MPIISNPGRNLSNTRNSVSSGYPNTEKRVENTTRRNSRCLDGR